MKTPALVLSLALLVLAAADLATQEESSKNPALLRAALSEIPVSFIENRGVFPDEVAFYVQGADKTLFFARDGITFRLSGKDRSWVVKLEFVETNPDVALRGEDLQQAVFSYFKGPEKDWKRRLRTFGRVVYEELWPGIGLVYRGNVKSERT